MILMTDNFCEHQVKMVMSLAICLMMMTITIVMMMMITWGPCKL